MPCRNLTESSANSALKGQDCARAAVQWHRFPEGHGLPELITQVPHIAFQVDDLDAEIEGANILFGPYSPLPGYRVAMIEEQGVPIELVETKLTDEELSLLEQKEFDKKKPY